MGRLVLAVLATVLLVGFAMANSHHIELSLVFGRPTEIRLIFLLGATYLTGLSSGLIWGMVRRLKRAEGRPVRLPPEGAEKLLKE